MAARTQVGICPRSVLRHLWHTVFSCRILSFLSVVLSNESSKKNYSKSTASDFFQSSHSSKRCCAPYRFTNVCMYVHMKATEILDVGVLVNVGSDGSWGTLLSRWKNYWRSAGQHRGVIFEKCVMLVQFILLHFLYNSSQQPWWFSVHRTDWILDTVTQFPNLSI